MSEFIYDIRYRPRFKMHIPHSLSRCSVEQKSGIATDLFDERQLLDLENDDVTEKEDAEDVELEGIDVATWEKKNRL